MSGNGANISLVKKQKGDRLYSRAAGFETNL